MRRNPRTRFRGLSLGAMLLALVLVGAACGDDDSGGGGGGGGGGGEKVTVAAANFGAEPNILAQIYGQALEAGGFDVTVEENYGTRQEILQGFDDGDVDLSIEYLGGLLNQLAGADTATSDVQEDVATLEPELEGIGLVALEPSEATDVDGLAVTQDTAEQYGLETYSDLAPVAGELTLGAPPECQENAACIPGFRDTYGIEFGEFVPLDGGAPIYGALENGDIDVARVFTTDPPIGELDLVVLEDDEGLNPAQNVIPVARDSVVNDEFTEIVNKISAALTTADLVELNGKVVNDKEDPADAAKTWLEDKGLI
jgi:osmoprotectant transport system substrate-binding protein